MREKMEMTETKKTEAEVFDFCAWNNIHDVVVGFSGVLDYNEIDTITVTDTDGNELDIEELDGGDDIQSVLEDITQADKADDDRSLLRERERGSTG
jgi:hypothetical protein